MRNLSSKKQSYLEANESKQIVQHGRIAVDMNYAQYPGRISNTLQGVTKKSER